MPETCPVCLAGHLQPTRSVFVQVYEDTLIHVPNIPAWKCDLCGNIYFDSITIRRTEILIGEAGPPPNHHDPTPRLASGDDDTPVDAHAEPD